MIVYGQDGKGKGKLGSSVYLINHGVQIKREYNGSVANPNTPAQVVQRSRFKLASQVSAVLEPCIVIPRKGIQSPRNLFVKRNMGFFYGGEYDAQVTYENLQITAGCVGIPAIIADRLSTNKLTLGLQSDVNKVVSHVVYNVFKKTDEGLLQFMDSVVSEIDADNTTGSSQINDIDGDLVIYAYGLKGRNARAVAKYGQYHVESGLDIARLVASRAIEAKDYMFTATRGTSLGAADDENVVAPDDSALIYITTNGWGDVRYKINDEAETAVTSSPIIVQIGDTLKLTGAGFQNHQFWGWYNNGEQEPFSTDVSITFVVNGMRDIVARWSNVGGLE